MRVWDNGEESAAVARENAYKMNAANEDQRTAAWTARQATAKRAEVARSQPAWAKNSVPGSSARALAEHATPAWRQERAEARRAAEAKARRDAIREALNPRPRDPRTTAERLADGAGQSRIDL